MYLIIKHITYKVSESLPWAFPILNIGIIQLVLGQPSLFPSNTFFFVIISEEGVVVTDDDAGCEKATLIVACFLKEENKSDTKYQG